MNFDVKSIIFIFTIKDGKISLLVKNNDFIYNSCTGELDLLNFEFVKNNIGIKEFDLKQIHTFSKKNDNKIELNILYIDIININLIELRDGFDFIELDKLDKNNIYIKRSIEYLKQKLILNNTIKKLYPNEFSLPEIQIIYENLLDKKIDRRNFRKKLIKQDIIEPLGEMSIGKTGRPASLYKFKQTEEKSLI